MGIVNSEGEVPSDLAEEPAMKDLLLEQVKKQGELRGRRAGEGLCITVWRSVSSRQPSLPTARALVVLARESARPDSRGTRSQPIPAALGHAPCVVRRPVGCDAAGQTEEGAPASSCAHSAGPASTARSAEEQARVPLSTSQSSDFAPLFLRRAERAAGGMFVATSEVIFNHPDRENFW